MELCGLNGLSLPLTEVPGASNLIGLTERTAFVRRLEIDPTLQARMSAGRWDQMIREGNATPAYLANDLNANGTTSSSDGQFSRVSDRTTKRGNINLHYDSGHG